MQRVEWAALVWAIALAVVIVAPPVLTPVAFSPYRLMSWGDVVDLATPLVMAPLYWEIVRLGDRRPPARLETAAFLVLLALWVEGQGMHLAANSIGHLLEGNGSSDLTRLTDMYDEVLSHYLWHAAFIGLSLLAVVRQVRHPFGERSGLRRAVLAGLIYGATFFMVVIEGQTWPLGLPAAFLMAGGIVLAARSRLRRMPIAALFLTGYTTALVLIAGWGAYWGALPEFSSVGIIK